MSRSITTMRCSKSTDMRRRSSASTLMPARSIVSSTGSSRRSTCSYSASPELKRSRGRNACHRRSATSASSGRVGGGALDRHLPERNAVAPGAGDLVVADRRMAEMQSRQLVQPVAVHAGLLGVGDQHRIVERRGWRKARHAPSPACRTWRSGRSSACCGRSAPARVRRSRRRAAPAPPAPRAAAADRRRVPARRQATARPAARATHPARRFRCRWRRSRRSRSPPGSRAARPRW